MKQQKRAIDEEWLGGSSIHLPVIPKEDNKGDIEAAPDEEVIIENFYNGRNLMNPQI